MCHLAADPPPPADAERAAEQDAPKVATEFITQVLQASDVCSLLC